VRNVIILLSLTLFFISTTKTCEVIEPDVILSESIGNVVALKQVLSENNNLVVITLTDKVQVWQNTTGSWQADTLELLCKPISMQVITDPVTQRPDIIVGAQSCFKSDNGIFVLYQQDKENWQAYSSDVIDNTGAFYNINAFVTPNNYLDVTATGTKNNRIYFFEWAEKQWFEISCLPRPDSNATTVLETFYLPNGTSCLANENSNESMLDLWSRTAEGWQLSQQISNNCSDVTVYDYLITDSLPTLVAGCDSGILLTSQLANNSTWSEPDYTKAHSSAISTLSHVEQNGIVILVSGSYDGTIKLWQRVNNGWELLHTVCIPGEVLILAVGPTSNSANTTLAVAAGYRAASYAQAHNCTLGLWYIDSSQTY